MTHPGIRPFNYVGAKGYDIPARPGVGVKPDKEIVYPVCTHFPVPVRLQLEASGTGGTGTPGIVYRGSAEKRLHRHASFYNLHDG